MAILKFRVYFEDDDSIYRDVAIRHTQSFFELHEAILRAYEKERKEEEPREPRFNKERGQQS